MALIGIPVDSAFQKAKILQTALKTFSDSLEIVLESHRNFPLSKLPWSPSHDFLSLDNFQIDSICAFNF